MFLGRTRARVPVPRMRTGTHGAFWYRREVVPVPLKVVPVLEDLFGPEEKWYRYHSKWYRYPIDSEELVPVPVNLKLAYFALLSPIFIHRLFRNPKKRLRGRGGGGGGGWEGSNKNETK